MIFVAVGHFSRSEIALLRMASEYPRCSSMLRLKSNVAAKNNRNDKLKPGGLSVRAPCKSPVQADN